MEIQVETKTGLLPDEGASGNIVDGKISWGYVLYPTLLLNMRRSNLLPFRQKLLKASRRNPI